MLRHVSKRGKYQKPGKVVSKIASDNSMQSMGRDLDDIMDKN